ncbi:ricin-type beta-trefoil lectin domain protein [Solihabitans fulvus]|uniref:Ricin-type beta-trefoil lectin domain protein n=1 Tax=Solihabitans fulvus TaxID=1892852 RepID=A0A5B2XBM3_9PSEU|nr:RICIN domain-containing protein [Solihabitans fulvus]KAA2260653.1 ricin-type beta-trefoil lectin domain protein [Solihabitans fulvus]
MTRLSTVRSVAARGATAILVAMSTVAVAAPAAPAAAGTTAWSSGAFSVDHAGLVRRSDVVLAAPNTTQAQAMPLGNGSFGAAVWAAGGFTAQLNRVDTLPDRRSPGWLTIPGLAALTGAPNFAAHLDVYDGVLYESGGGMTATIYLRADKDELVVDVTGADPATTQTAEVALWSGRSPQAETGTSIATLAETWVDDSEPGHTGNTYGSLAAVTAGGSRVSTSTVDSRTVQVSVTPRSDGSFRVIAAAPRWSGGDAQAAASALIGTDAEVSSAALRSGHLAWWHGFWGRVGLVKLSSSDGSADYLENLRTLDLYDAAAQSRGTVPGSQAGVADLFSPYQDAHKWSPGAYWHWNMRMQVQANISAGAFDLNTPYFRLYQQNLANIQAWTRAHLNNRAGICVPETMRFNGAGYEYETWLSSTPVLCDSSVGPYYNARTITTGAEVGLWVWQQYLTTNDRGFLSTNYPLLAEASRFLLAYSTVGSDGYRHTFPSNAHETQWDVHDPTTDIAAMQALFPATIQAASVLGKGNDPLIGQLTAAQRQLRPLPRTDIATQRTLLSPSDDAAGADMIAPSYDVTASSNNSENIGLEPVWPYGLIGDQGGLSELAKRTFANRPNTLANDWSYDPLQAARLGDGANLASTLVGLTKQYQKLPSGLATFVGDEPYGEQQGVVAAALNEALVQDYDGVLRIAPALPQGWDAEGTVFIHGNSRASVQVHGGVIGTVGINAGSTGTITVRSPWPGRRVEVVDGADEKTVVVAGTTAAQLSIPAVQGSSYLVEPVDAPVSGMTVAAVTGTPATGPRTLGPATIGIPGGTVPPGTHTLVGVGSGRCLDDPGASTQNDTQVIIYDCNGAQNQKWTYAADQTLATMGKCLDASGGGTTNYTKVIIYDCSGGQNQKWTFAPDGTIRGVQSGLCLDVANGATGNNSPLQLWTCSAGPNQTWTRR